MSIDNLINQYGRTITIGARANTVDDVGGVFSTFTSTTNVTGWLQPLSASEQALYGAERHRETYRVFFPAGTSVANDSQLTVTINSEVRTLDVLGVELPGEMAGGALQRVEVIAQETGPRA